ncbi:MAG: right-handed parallel beta-helix repeat-containing protein [Bryobacterales bacterium]|nr:right-handed parallel beta-helix repeat-containing protein [Bryobacterales bacterium]
MDRRTFLKDSALTVAGPPAVSIMLAGCLQSAASAAEAAAEFYVAPDGSDANPGSLAKPFATLVRARDAIRALKQSGRMPDGGGTVFVRGGTYAMTAPVVFEPGDNGTPEGHISYTAFPGETAVLDGGTRINGWKQLTEPLADLPQVAAGKLWIAEVSRGWRFRRLYWNGSLLPRASVPDGDQWEKWPLAKPGGNERQIMIPEGMIRRWPYLPDVELNVLPTLYSYWQNRILPVVQTDDQTGTITFGQRVSPSDLRLPDKIPFRIENTLDGISQSGKWRLDSQNGRLYLWPPDDADPSEAEIVVPALSGAIELRGNEEQNRFVRFLDFRDLNLTHMKDVAILIRSAEDCAIERCKIMNAAGDGIQVRLYAQRLRLAFNEISRIGGTGILITGYPAGTHQVNRDHLIAGNHLHHCGELNWRGAGISLNMVGNSTIRNNLIHDMPYGGIMVIGPKLREFQNHWGSHRWDEIGEGPFTVENIKRFIPGYNVVEKNIIHDFHLQLDDGGGIYIHATHHNLIRDNLVYRSAREYSFGIYLDNNEIDTVIENNVVYQCPDPAISDGSVGSAILLHANGRNTVRNNILADGHRLFFFNKSCGGQTMTHNVLLYGERPQLKPKPDPALTPQAEFDAGASVMDDNLFWAVDDSARAKLTSLLAVWRARGGWDRDSIVADPLLADPEKLDFSLKPDSPAYKLGFKPIDLSDLGPLPRHDTQGGGAMKRRP